MKYIRNGLIAILTLILVGVSARLVLSLIEAKKAERIYPVREQCTCLKDAVNLYKANYGVYPSGSNALAILIKDEDSRKLLKNTNLDDPWGTPFRLRIVNGNPVVDSAGQDRIFDTSDDIHSF